MLRSCLSVKDEDAEKRLEMKHPQADRLDMLMCVFFNFTRQVCYKDGKAKSHRHTSQGAGGREFYFLNVLQFYQMLVKLCSNMSNFQLLNTVRTCDCRACANIIFVFCAGCYIGVRVLARIWEFSG